MILSCCQSFRYDNLAFFCMILVLMFFLINLTLQVAPVVGPITVTPTVPVPVNTPITFSASFTDADIDDAHTATLDWEGSTSGGTVSEIAETVTGTHTCTSAGVYTVYLTVTDSQGATGTSPASQYVVVYDPNAGFVTGGGWIMSPAGAYTAVPGLTGKATFGFLEIPEG
jgi:PKD repeat protein